MARIEGYNEGTVPLHMISEDVDNANDAAETTSGKIVVKFWITKDEIV